MLNKRKTEENKRGFHCTVWQQVTKHHNYQPPNKNDPIFLNGGKISAILQTTEF
jgi:hypothetical protein